jgi:predicted GIY-YIG superfamily endonuclease
MMVSMNRRSHPLLDAQDCIRNLTMNPIKLLILQRTNVFIFEEIGLVSAEMFAVLDSVMKYVMSCDLPFGGKLVIANGNHVQLQPIEGRPFWMSTHFMMSFDAIVLKEYVRMANDPTLQNILQLLRKSVICGEERKQVLDAIDNHCEFVDSWNQVPSARMRVLTTKKAQENINSKFLDEKLNEPNLRCVKSKSTDEILEGDRWKPCSGFRQKALNRNASEPQEMILFKGAIMCFTYNCNEGNTIFSQGGLCIVTSIPQEFNRESKVTVILVPPGETNFVPPQRHWQQIEIGRKQGLPILVGPGIFARRTQYPFRYYTVQNFHRVMGCTAQGGIATQLSIVTKEFRMWDLGQLIVLLSRVTNIKMITFVGSKEDNLNAVEEIMTKEGKFTQAINERLIALDVLTSPPQRIITDQANPFIPIRREIPNATGGYVYLLVCIHEPNLCYVGETGRSLILRLREHNSGTGSKFTKGKAWALYAYVFNFPSPYQTTNRIIREWFEKRIHRIMRKNFWPWQVKDAMTRASTNYNLEEKAACIVHEVGRLDEHTVRIMARQKGSEPEVRSDPPQERIL